MRWMCVCSVRSVHLSRMKIRCMCTQLIQLEIRTVNCLFLWSFCSNEKYHKMENENDELDAWKWLHCIEQVIRKIITIRLIANSFQSYNCALPNFFPTEKYRPTRALSQVSIYIAIHYIFCLSMIFFSLLFILWCSFISLNSPRPLNFCYLFIYYLLLLFSFLLLLLLL